ncbi:MAG: phosphoglycerate kinase [candidate division Zixibacteria bacterium]|nr:phosphoglycerate kinase [candidate division Zixibacteria bacterium]
MNKLSVRDISCAGKRVLVRVDFNVPLDKQGRITDDTRIVESLPTIKKILDDGGRAILCSHLGRPKGKPVPEMSLRPVAEHLADLLKQPVKFADDCIGPEADQKAKDLKDGQCLLLENLRFHKEEEANDPEFARKLASLAEMYVSDAFGTVHRAHASTEGVTRYFDKAVAGFLIEKELKYLGQALASPQRPFTAVLGGAKISGKIDVINNLLDKVDNLLIGGGMAFTFFKAMGKEIGTSLLEEDKIDLAKQILAAVGRKKVNFMLPVDCIVADDIKEDAAVKIVGIDAIPATMKGLDIGPKTLDQFSRVLQNSKTIVWNGPMGVFEVEKFSLGTVGLAGQMAQATDHGAVSIIGGGDSAAAAAKAGVEKRITHISTGGGASLEFLEGKTLPGIAALTDAKVKV